MPIRDPEARQIDIRCTLGPDRAAIAANSYTLHLFFGDPMSAGVELADTTEIDDGTGTGGTTFWPNGYLPAAVDSDDFVPTADFGMTVSVQFADVTAPYSHEATHWAFKAVGTGYWHDCGPLIEPLIVTGPLLDPDTGLPSGSVPGPLVIPVIFHDDSVTEG